MLPFLSVNCICPYCYQKNNKKNMKVMCTNARCSKYKKEMFALENACCTECGVKMKKLCQHCGSPLEDSMLEIREKNMFPLAMIGLKSAGKSNYIAVAIQELRARGNNLGLNTLAMNQDTSDRYRANFYNYIYQNHMVVPQTDAANAKEDVQKPLIYKIIVSDKNQKPKSSLLLSFYDTAGENLSRSEEDTESHASYISYAQGLILLVDPWQISTVREKMNQNGASLPDNKDIGCRDMIERVIRIIRKNRNCGEKDKINVPIAVVFSKIDSFSQYGFISSDSCLCRESRHMGARCYLKEEHEDTNIQMKNFLERWTVGTESDGIVPLLESAFSDCAFFGVSAFSGGVDKYGKINCKDGNIGSLRVLDPFLWLLYKNGSIKMK